MAQGKKGAKKNRQRRNAIMRKEKIILFALVVLFVVLLCLNQSLQSERNSVETTLLSSASHEPHLDWVDLKIDLGKLQTNPEVGRPCWPPVSSLETFREPDLTTYIGKSREEQPFKGLTIILDPGHGGSDVGATYPTQSKNPELLEKEIVLSVALKTRSVLKSMGASVIMTREKDEWVSVYKRIAMISRMNIEQAQQDLDRLGMRATKLSHLIPLMDEIIRINSDSATSGGRGLFQGAGVSADQRLLMDLQRQYPDVLLLSLHCNAWEGDRSGLQIYYETTETTLSEEKDLVFQPGRGCYFYYDDESRKHLANTLYKAMTEQMPEMNYDGALPVSEADFAILREVNMTSALIELGFLTSEKDRTIFRSPDQRQKIAEAIVEGVYRFYCYASYP